jgi:ATP-dependent exoDNAse (exonuclease V) alpha subunit
MYKCNLQAEIDKKINRLYKEWQTNVSEKFAQLNYGYSITVHKSQGSTFNNVFIDISDILENNNIEETSKCLYTAITRCSDMLVLLV